MANFDTNVPEIQVQYEKGNVSSENGTESDEEKNQKLKLHPRRDSGSSVGDDEEIAELTAEQRELIVSQAEYYFSDENLKRDGFLLKHVKRNKEGYVNLKLLASFKKMRSLSRDYRVIGEALKGSKKLTVNETGLKVRRVDPLSKELLDQIRVKLVVVSNIPQKNPSMNYITDVFPDHKDDVVSVRIVKPGKKFPNDLQSHFSRHPEFKDEVVAVVEFDNPDIASAAVKSFSEVNDGFHVKLLELGPKQGKKKDNGETASDTPIDSDASTGETRKQRQKKKKGGRLLEVYNKDDSCYSSSDSEFSSFSSCGKRYNRSHGSSPSHSPKLNRPMDSNNNSNNTSPMSSPAGSPAFPRKKTPIDNHSPVRNGLKLSPLLNGSPRSSPETKRKNFKLKDEISPGQSAWMLKRMQLNENKENVNTDLFKLGHKHLDVVRQPKGPDGSNGFFNHPLKKYILVHAS